MIFPPLISYLSLLLFGPTGHFLPDLKPLEAAKPKKFQFAFFLRREDFSRDFIHVILLRMAYMFGLCVNIRTYTQHVVGKEGDRLF